MQNDLIAPAVSRTSRLKRLRDNWPLTLGVAAFIFVVFCLLYSQTVPQYPNYYRIPVIYLLLVFSSAILIFIPIILLIVLLLIAIWCFQQRRKWAFFAVAVAANLGVCYACFTTGFTGSGVTHQQRLAFRGHIYYLGTAWDNSDWDYPQIKFVVYDCDPIGFLCLPIYLSNSNFSDENYFADDVATKTTLIADDSNNMVYLQVGNRILYVKDVEPDQPPAPVALPTLATLSTDNAVQATELLTLIRGSVSQVAWSPDGKTLAVGGKFLYREQSDEPGVWLYDRDNLQSKPRLLRIDYQGEPRLSAESVAFSPDGHLLAAGGGDYTVRLWNIDTGTQIGVLPRHNDAVNAVTFSPDGKVLASGSPYDEVRLWNVETQSPITILKQEDRSGGLFSIAFSPDGKLLASAGRELHIWDLTSGEIQTTIPLSGEYPRINSVAFSPDGKRLAYGGSQNILSLWDMQSNADVVSFNIPGDMDDIQSVAFSPDGSLLATGDFSGMVRIWNAKTGTRLTLLTGHNSQVNSVAFSPDGKLLASTSQDGTVRLWGVPVS